MAPVPSGIKANRPVLSTAIALEPAAPLQGGTVRTEVSAPVLPMLKTWEPALPRATYRKRLVGSTVSRPGVPPALVAAPTEVSVPLLWLTWNAEMSPEPPLLTYTNDPLGEAATAAGVVPAANGEPVTAASAPVLRFT